MNEQPWDFVLCTGRETLERLAATWRYAQHVAGSAATVVLVAPIPSDQDSRDWVFYDMGQATMSMMLAAADLGIGSSHAALDDQALAREILGIPEDRFCVGLVAFGYPADRPLAPISRPRRRPFDDVVHRERW
jgi:nitroreductase